MKKKHRRAVYIWLTTIPLLIAYCFLGISMLMNLIPKGYSKGSKWLKTKLRVYDTDPD